MVSSNLITCKLWLVIQPDIMGRYRVQGDGLMVYFGWKNKDKADSSKDA